MAKSKSDCTQTTNNSRIVCEEKGQKITFINKKRILINKTKIDKCLVLNKTICDFLVTYNNVENFIELKGHHIEHAFKQLEQCIKKFSKDDFDKKFSYVISSRSPLTSTEIQKFKINFKKRFASTLIVKTKEHEVIV